MIETKKFDFDRIVERRGTNSIKWDSCACCADDTDMLPMWVADMDFLAPQSVLDSVARAASHGIFGYSALPRSSLESVAGWCEQRYDWDVSPDWLSYTSGVITGLNIAIQTFTRPGEKIVIQSPVYPPFASSILMNGRRIIHNNLLTMSDGDYVMDLDGLRSSIDSETKMLVLCNPHNPVGRVWSRDELTALAEIAMEHDLLVFSDEIHADLVIPPKKHVALSALSPEIAKRTITGMAPSKTFNIAGLKASIIITPDAALRSDFDKAQDKTFGLYSANTFAIAAMESAYTQGAEWLDELLVYLQGSRDKAIKQIAETLPDIRCASPEATFLMWLDFSGLGLDHEEIKTRLECEAGLLLNDGRSFGPGGNQHFRLNFGCPRSRIFDGLERLRRAFHE